MSIPTPADLPSLAEGTVVHVEAHFLPCRWGGVIRSTPDGDSGLDTVHEVRLDDGGYIKASRGVLCPIFALPVPDHCRGRWDFHPPAPGIS